MSGWESDLHGLVLKATEVKIYYQGNHTWAMKLSQLHRQQGIVRIMTYSLPDLSYVVEQFERRPHGIFILCHSRFRQRAQVIKSQLPNIQIATHDRVHAKVLLIEPQTCYFGSANFGHSGWHEVMIGIRSKAAHDSYVQYGFNPVWEQASPLPML